MCGVGFGGAGEMELVGDLGGTVGQERGLGLER